MKLNLRELFVPTIMISMLGTGVLSIMSFVFSRNTAVYYPIEIWMEASNVMDFFLPLIVVIPYAFLLVTKCKNSFINYVMIRINQKTYISTQIILAAVMTIGAVFIMYFSSLLLTVCVFFQGSNSDSQYILAYMWGEYQANSPLIFGLIWCLWKGIVASLFTIFGCMLALVSDNIFVVCITPFIYCMAENMITGLLGISKFSLFTSIVLNRLEPTAMSIWSYVIGIIIYIVIVSCIIFLLYRKRRIAYEYVETT